MASEEASDREDGEQLQRRFVEFRQTHTARSRLPKQLWAVAAKLARRDGISATARVLGVDRPSLQKWTDRLEPRGASAKSPIQKGSRGQGRDRMAAPAFVELELLAANTAIATSCVVEVESRSGGKLRLDLKAIAPSQLAELIRAFAAS
jgi:transposase-like protein